MPTVEEELVVGYSQSERLFRHEPPVAGRTSTVLQVLSTTGRVGEQGVGVTGPERRTLGLLDRWAGAGINAVVLYPKRGPLWESFVSTGCHVIDFEVVSKTDARSVLTLCSIIQATGAKIVHTQGGPAVDLVACIAARLSGAAAVVTRPVMIDDNAHQSRLSRKIRRLVDRIITLRLAHSVIAISLDGYSRLSQYHLGNRLIMIANGVDTARFFPKEGPGASCDHLRVGMVGHLRTYKGWDDFVSVAQAVSDLPIQFLAAGTGPLEGELRARVSSSGIDGTIQFLGYVEDVPSFLRKIDILLFLSRREGMPVAVLEAMASGLPIVSTPVGGVPELVKEGKNGFLVSVGDTAAAETRIRQLVADPGLRESLGKESRRLAVQHYSDSRMFEEQLRVYNRCLHALERNSNSNE